MPEAETIQQDVSPAAAPKATSEATEQSQLEPGAVETPETRGPVVDPISRREQKMREASDKARAEREGTSEKYKEINGDFDPQDPAPESSLQGESDEEAPNSQTQGSRPGWDVRDDGTMVKKIKVNGQVRELTEEQYDAYLSKELAGDQKLRMASDMERKLRDRSAALDAREAALANPPPPQPGATDEEVDKALAEYHDAIFEGDTDAAKEKLKTIMQAGRQTTTPNLDAMRQQIKQEVKQEVRQEADQERVQDSVHEGWKGFQEKYRDIAEHPKRLAYADATLKAIIQEQPHLSPKEAILEAGRITAEELGMQPAESGGESEPLAGEATAERQERKANLKPIPRRGSSQHQPRKEPALDMSPQAKIARMRAGRVTA